VLTISVVYRPQAISLVVLVALDILLDLAALAHVSRPRRGWPLLLRLLLGIGYLAIFMTYVGLGRVFPWGFSYWGIAPGFAGPVVYLFLWLIGVWNLLNTALHRRMFGQDMRLYASLITRALRRRKERTRAPAARRDPGNASAFWAGRGTRVPAAEMAAVDYDVEMARAGARAGDIQVDTRTVEPKADQDRVTPSSRWSESTKTDSEVAPAGTRQPAALSQQSA